MIGAVGQVFGSIAVFVTLGYLAVQVKHAQSEARRALSQGRGEANREILMFQSDERVNRLCEQANAALGRPPSAFVATLTEKTGQTHEEAAVLPLLEVARWSYRLQIIPNVDELSPMERGQFEGAIRGSYGQPGVSRLFYEFSKPYAHPDAVRYIDNLLAQPGGIRF